MRQGFQSRSSSCRNKEGEIMTNNTDVLRSEKAHFQNLYGEREDKLELQAHTLAEIKEKDEEIPIPTIEEVWNSIRNLDTNKAPGPDGPKVELF